MYLTGNTSRKRKSLIEIFLFFILSVLRTLAYTRFINLLYNIQSSCIRLYTHMKFVQTYSQTTTPSCADPLQPICRGAITRFVRLRTF